MTLKYASSDETSLELSLDGSQTTILQLPATSDVVIEKDFLIEGLTASEDIRKLRIKHLESSGIKLWDITFENVQNQTELDPNSTTATNLALYKPVKGIDTQYGDQYTADQLVDGISLSLIHI